MRHLTGLLPDGLKQEIYGLWEVNNHTNAMAGSAEVTLPPSESESKSLYGHRTGYSDIGQRSNGAFHTTETNK